MSKRNHNRTYGYLIFWCLVIVAAWMLSGFLMSCNTPKHAAKLFDKANRKSPLVVASKCGQMFPPISSKDSIYLFKEGATKVLYDTLYMGEAMVIGDTIYRTKIVQKSVNKTDTVYIAKKEVIHNAAKEQSQGIIISDNEKKIAKQADTNKWLWWIVGILGAYTLLRLILKRWIKLP